MSTCCPNCGAIEVREALVEDFGAEAGDEIVDAAANAMQRWRLAG